MQPPTRAWRPTNRDQGPIPHGAQHRQLPPAAPSRRSKSRHRPPPPEVKGGSSQTVISTREAMKAASSLRVGRAQVQPHHRARPLQDVGNLGGRAVLASSTPRRSRRVRRMPQPSHPSEQTALHNRPTTATAAPDHNPQGGSSERISHPPTGHYAGCSRRTLNLGSRRFPDRSRAAQHRPGWAQSAVREDEVCPGGAQTPRIAPKWNTTTLTGARGASSGGRPG
jgi:hypothetical protein